MRPFSLFRVLVCLVVIALIATSSRGDGNKQASGSDPKHDGKQPANEDVRYDGKPFSYWQSYWRTELKAERRIETLHAMAAFGRCGYVKEATATILDIQK